MAVVTSPFTIVRGDTWIETWTITDASGVALDLTGGKLYMTIKTNRTDADNVAILQLTSPSSGIVLTNASGGIATMTMTSTQTAAIAPATYWYDVQFKDASGNITTLDRGQVTVDYDLTITTA